MKGTHMKRGVYRSDHPNSVVVFDGQDWWYPGWEMAEKMPEDGLGELLLEWTDDHRGWKD